jgi:hypothetical protein
MSLLYAIPDFSASDRLSVTRQMERRKFDAALILGTANRCRFGFPRVVLCVPLRGLVPPRGMPPWGMPFPTSFWLTCPWLARSAGEAESDGGVRELERWIGLHAPGEWIPFNILHQRLRLSLLPEAALRFLRRFRPQLFERLRGGVGGIRFQRTRREIHVKCLHLQTASWLALHRHPGAPWLAAHGAGQDCGGAMTARCGATETAAALPAGGIIIE